MVCSSARPRRLSVLLGHRIRCVQRGIGLIEINGNFPRFESCDARSMLASGNRRCS